MKNKLTIEKVESYVKSRGYSLVEIVGKIVKTKMHVILTCPNKHLYKVQWNNFNTGSDCKKCGSKKALKKDSLKEYFKNSDYEFIDSCIKNRGTVVRIKCPNLHEYEVPFNRFKAGVKCGRCRGHHLNDLESVRMNIANFGFTLKSTTYKNKSTDLDVVCSNGHETKMPLLRIEKGKQCVQCYHFSQKIPFSIVKETIEKEQYILISTSYNTLDSPLEIKCPKGHIYKARFRNFRDGCRCPKCRIWANESYVRKIFESILNKEFKKCTPEWLINPSTKMKLELDGYCEELKLAFEYDGEWHYKNHFKGLELKKQNQRDKAKDILCANNQVTLIRIPYFIENKEVFIKEKLKELKLIDQ